MERAILHVDMDAFYASVEQHDHPEWRGKPVIVGAAPNARGVVATCSYEARAYGVHSAMPSQTAYRLCPEGLFVPPRMARYQEVSDGIFQLFGTFTPDVEAVSVDEAFLDVTGVRRLFGEPHAIAQQIKARMREQFGLTCSVGIAPNKFLAKLASEEKKPDGLFAVPRDPQALLAWLGAKPIRALWGVGPKLAETLLAHNIQTVRDLQSINPERLLATLTPATVDHLMAIAFGRDSRPVTPEHEDKSYSHEHTYPTDTTDFETLRADLRALAEAVGRRLRAAGHWAQTGRIKLRYADFRTVTRQAPFDVPSCDDFALRDHACALLAQHLDRDNPIRLIGFGVDHLTDNPSPYDPDDLLARHTGEDHPRERYERISHTLDALRAKHPRRPSTSTPPERP